MSLLRFDLDTQRQLLSSTDSPAPPHPPSFFTPRFKHLPPLLPFPPSEGRIGTILRSFTVLGKPTDRSSYLPVFLFFSLFVPFFSSTPLPLSSFSRHVYEIIKPSEQQTIIPIIFRIG